MKTIIIKLSSLLLLSIFSINAHAIYIDSDGHTILDFAEYNNYDTVTSYGGINFSNTLVISQQDFGVGDNTSGLNSIAYLGGIGMDSASAGGFDLYDAYFKTYADTTFTVSGTNTDSQALSQSFDLLANDGWTQINFDFFNVQELDISVTGTSQFFIDSIDVPEPSTLALLGLGLLGLSLTRLQRKA